MPQCHTPTQSTANPTADWAGQPLLFEDLGPRQVVADFTGGDLSSDGGVLLLRQIDQGLGLSRTLAACFHDTRDARFVEHAVPQLVAQRLYGLALGYEDLNDHAFLRRDPLLATACDKLDPLGLDRLTPARCGAALAAPATLNRLELSNNKTTRCHKLAHDPAAIEQCLLTMGARCLPKHAREVVLDLDAMGHLVHGTQEGRHFSAYYDGYCYLPLYVFCGAVPLWAQLRTAAEDGAAGTVPALAKIVAAIRQRSPQARIIARADAGFCREEILAWCEAQPDVYYCVGLPKNSVLLKRLAPALADARARRCLTGAATARVFTEFEYQTGESWSRARRVIGKAEVSAAGDNPRFVVTNLPAAGFPEDAIPARFEPTPLYEDLYCARGEMENVLKQQTLDLEADRLSTHWQASNQLRLWLATFAYLLLDRVRAIGCVGTDLARATAGSVRLRLLKVAAVVRVSVRRVWVQLSRAWAWQEEYRACQRRLAAWSAGGADG
jgi:hypothetical protein